ncbi:fibroin-3 related protein [Colletotrichum truncatum]|uniref:Fibroin-3 related protein n=1 Tax=Colletotrichum truncatum TaxID=5467 RepID=A0ACC3Z4V0_COLTU|nr:fibroin-3 related protein [Colletotrichum truncatum]KAF6788653.1 fibroin-3 related protein [Colletotrichum truncatum]
MPTIDVAMARSLRGGVWGSVMSSMAASIQRRQIMSTVENAGNQINDVKTALSSWDNCMSVNYCKWPVIGVIIVGGLIIFSIVWCIIRCACCGLSCCCQCCYCLKCCGNCCGCCDTPKGTPHKYLDDQYGSTNQGYKSQAPMHAPVAPFLNNPPAHAAHSTAPAAAAPPQYAEFEVSKSGNAADADALPAMPSWEGAGSKKVAIEEEVELEPMKKPAASPNAQNAPLMAPNAMSHPNSPMPNSRSPYAQSQAGASGYFSNANQPVDPYAANGQGFNNYDNGYAQSNAGLGVDQYGAGAAAVGGMAMAQGRRTPAREYNNSGYGPQRGQTYPPPQQDYDQGFDNYEQGGYGMGHPPRNGPSPAPRSFTAPPRNGPSPAPAGYRRSPGPEYRGSPAPPADYRRSPAPPNDYRRSPAPQNDYGYDQQDQYANDGYGHQQYGGDGRQFSSESTRPLAPPQRSYTADNPPLSPDLQNSGGFDFQSGYSRPQQYNYNRGPNSSAQQMPAELDEQRPPQSSGGTYPGYKAYQPTKEGWSGV